MMVLGHLDIITTGHSNGSNIISGEMSVGRRNADPPPDLALSGLKYEAVSDSCSS